MMHRRNHPWLPENDDLAPLRLAYPSEDYVLDVDLSKLINFIAIWSNPGMAGGLVSVGESIGGLRK
jgi:hypothetical protein